MRLLRTLLLTAAIFSIGVRSATAAPILIDFEGLSDLEDVTSQFAALGVSFTGATVLLSGSIGGSLNDIDFPPHSGFAVVADLNGPMRIDFATGATAFSGRFTYVAPVTISAFAGATLLTSVSSLFAENITASQNELLELTVAMAMTHILIEGSPLGGSFTLDNAFVETAERTDPDHVPEPATLTLLLTGAALLGARRRLSARQAAHGTA